MDEKYTGRKFYGLYDPTSPSAKRDPKSVEDIKDNLMLIKKRAFLIRL